MMRKDFLLEQYHDAHNSYVKRHKDFYANPSIARIDPFKIADGLYYVGDKMVCIHQLKEGGKPFVAPNSWRDFLSELKVSINNIVEGNKAFDKKLNALFGD